MRGFLIFLIVVVMLLCSGYAWMLSEDESSFYKERRLDRETPLRISDDLPFLC